MRLDNAVDKMRKQIATPSIASSKVSVRSGNTQMRLTSQNLQQLKSNIGSLHELDIFKICCKTMQPSQYAQIMPALTARLRDSSYDKQTED